MANDYTILSEVLHCTTGNSDKVYEIEVRSEGRNFVTRGRYGRRGSVLKPVEKYKGTSEWRAEQAYHDTVNEKLRGGYRRVVNNHPPILQILRRLETEEVVMDPQPKAAPLKRPPAKKKKPKQAEPPAPPERNLSFDL